MTFSEPVGSASVEIHADLSSFDTELRQKLRGSLDAINRAGSDAGKSFGAGVTASASGIARSITGIFATVGAGRLLKGALTEAADAARVGRLTEAVIRSTGGAAQVTARQVGALADSLSRLSGVDDEVIQGAENVLLTFTAVRNQLGAGNDVFDRGTKAALDLSAALGTDLQSATIQVGKALQDPAQGLLALRRAGVSFTDQQKDQIKALQESGDLLGAQKIILAELNKEFGGAAAANVTAFDRIHVAVRNLAESVGTALVPVLDSLTPALEAVTGFFGALAGPLGHLPPALVAFAAAAATTAIALKALAATRIAALFAGVGPAASQAAAAVGLLVTEIVTGGEVAAAAGIAFDAMLGPIGLVALAVGAVAAAFVVFHRETVTTEERIRRLGDAALDSAAKFKLLTGIDVHQLVTDLNALANIKAPAPDVTPTVLAIHQLADAGNDLDTVREKFHDLLDPKFGAAGIGAAQEALDALRAAGLGQSAIAKELQADLDKEIAARQRANDLTERGTGLLNADSDARDRNAERARAQTAAITDLFSVTDQLAKATRALSAATDDQTAAQKRLDDLRREGGAAERADATRKLTDARDALTAAIDRQTTAQQRLDALNAPATERELADGADALTTAQIRLARALRARLEAEKALEPHERSRLNLAGLTLDQLRATLANERATLTAQRQAAPTGKTPAELAEDATLAEIGVRQAVEGVTDAQTELNDLKDKGRVTTTETVAAQHELTAAKNATARAQDGVNGAQADLDRILAGNSQWARALAAAQGEVRTAVDRVREAAQTVADLTARQRDDTSTILGTEELISAELLRQIQLHKDLFAVANPSGNAVTQTAQRTLIESQLTGAGAATVIGEPIAGFFTDKAIAELFAALVSGNLSAFVALLKRFGIVLPGHEAGALVTRPELAWIGEKFKVESVIPWSRPDRVWAEMARALPHMPPTVRDRLEPAIHPEAHRISRPGTLPSEAPMTAQQAEKMLAILERIEQKVGATNDVDINVAPTPGMSEAQLARKVQRELQRYWGNS